VGCFVHLSTDAVSAVVFHEPETGAPSEVTDGMRDVAELPAGLRGGDAGVECGLGGFDQRLVSERGRGVGVLADAEADRGVAAPAAVAHAAVDADEVAGGQGEQPGMPCTTASLTLMQATPG